VAAAYSESSWKKINSALNILEKFAIFENIKLSWPVSEYILIKFIDWAASTRNLAPSSISSYMSHIKLIHKLRGLNSDACDSFICKTQIKGAKNLKFYETTFDHIKKVMTLPLLKILGHSIAVSNWSDHSKCIVWSAACIAFFGSFRFGEILPKNDRTFDTFETLMWTDVKMFNDESVQIHVKIPKTRTPKGEYVSLFKFPDDSCCPIKTMLCLKKFQYLHGRKELPLFTFANNTFLTKEKFNKYLVFFLKPYIGNEAFFYSCKSFRGALPSALAAFPLLGNDIPILRWGRWNSKAFERYTRLNHIAKKEIFGLFVKALYNA